MFPENAIQREKIRINRDYMNFYRRKASRPPLENIQDITQPIPVASSSMILTNTTLENESTDADNYRLGRATRLWKIWKIWDNYVSDWAPKYFTKRNCEKDFGKFVQDFLNRKIKRASGIESVNFTEFKVFKVLTQVIDLDEDAGESLPGVPYCKPYNLRAKELSSHSSEQIWTLSSGGDLAHYLESTFSAGEIFIVSIKRNSMSSLGNKTLSLNFIPSNVQLNDGELDDWDYPSIDIIRIPPPSEGRNDTHVIESIMPLRSESKRHIVNYVCWNDERSYDYRTCGLIFRMKLELWTLENEELAIKLPIVEFDNAEDLYSDFLMRLYIDALREKKRKMSVNNKNTLRFKFTLQDVKYVWANYARKMVYTAMVATLVSCAWFFKMCDLCIKGDPIIEKLEQAAENSTFFP